MVQKIESIRAILRVFAIGEITCERGRHIIPDALTSGLSCYRPNEFLDFWVSDQLTIRSYNIRILQKPISDGELAYSWCLITVSFSVCLLCLRIVTPCLEVLVKPG